MLVFMSIFIAIIYQKHHISWVFQGDARLRRQRHTAEYWMEILIYTLLFLVFAYIFRVELQNKLTFNPVPKAPLVPQGTFHSILFNNPRDQAMEKCLKLVPDSRDLGFYVTQLFFNPIIFILDEKLARKVLRNISTYFFNQFQRITYL